MKTDDLINKLALEAKIVKAIDPWYVYFGKWLISAMLCLALSLALLGVKEDWSDVFKNPVLLIQNILIIIGILLSAAAAFLLGRPEYFKKNRFKFIVFSPLVVWGLLLALQSIYLSDFNPQIGLDCVFNIFVIGFIPSVLLFLFIQKGIFFLKGYAGFFILASCAGIGAWAIQFTCHNNDPAHILVWHFLPVLLLGLIGAKLGKFILKKI